MIIKPLYHFFNKNTPYLIVFFVVFSIVLPGSLVVENVETDIVHHEILISDEMPDRDLDFDTDTNLPTDYSGNVYPDCRMLNVKKIISVKTIFPDDILFPPPEYAL